MTTNPDPQGGPRTVADAIAHSAYAFRKAQRDFPEGFVRNACFSVQAQDLLDAFAKFGVMNSDDPEIVKLKRMSKGNIEEDLKVRWTATGQAANQTALVWYGQLQRKTAS